MTIRERSVCKGLVGRRMYVDYTQHPAQVEEFRTVQVQHCHSRPSRRSTAQMAASLLSSRS
jgi:hypothetical protein